MNMELGTFTSLVLSIHGSTGPQCSAYHANLADKIATKTGEQYANVLSLIRCKLSFILLYVHTNTQRHWILNFSNTILKQFFYCNINKIILTFLVSVQEMPPCKVFK